MPLVIQHTHTHCSTLVWMQAFSHGGAKRLAARILLRAQADALSSASRCSRPPTPPQLNNLIAAKYSHRSKDSGGPGTTLCCVARFLTAEHLSHGKTYCSERFSSAAAEPIHPANPAKNCEQFSKTCSGLTQSARISPTERLAYGRDSSIAGCL